MFTHASNIQLSRDLFFWGWAWGRERRWVVGGEVVHNPFKRITQPVINGLTSWPVQRASVKSARADLLLIVADAQISDSLDGVLDVSLLVGLDVDVAFQSLFGHHRLDLQRLESKDRKWSHPCKRKSRLHCAAKYPLLHALRFCRSWCHCHYMPSLPAMGRVHQFNRYVRNSPLLAMGLVHQFNRYVRNSPLLAMDLVHQFNRYVRNSHIMIGSDEPSP